MNKLRPNTIARADPREDGFKRTSNVTSFLASCLSQGVPSEHLFHRDDLIESNPESLARVARTIIAVVKVVEFPVVDRSKVVTGQGKKASQSSDNKLGPYGYGTSSRASLSVPNLLQPSTSPTGPTTPTGRKRWSPPSPNLPTVRSVSPSERGSGDSSRTNSNKNGRATPVADQPKVVAHALTVGPPTLTPRSPLREQSKTKLVNDRADAPNKSESFTVPTLGAESSAQRSGTEPVARQSIVSSTATDISAYSSLLDARQNSNNKFATIRTTTTEATSFAPSDMPSYTRTEASSVAASLSDETTRKRGGRDRKPTETAVVDLSRVNEERPEDLASRPGSKAGPPVDKDMGTPSHGDDAPGPEKVHLGKGKWPDDFLDVFKGQSRARPIPTKSAGREYQDSSSTRHSPISVSPPRKFAIVGSSRISESLDSIPRRPTHLPRHSVETVSLAPKESVLKRDVSPDGIPSRIVPRRASANRNGFHLPRDGLDSNGGSPVPFPRNISGENGSASPAPSSPEGYLGLDNDRSRQLRGRFHSEVEGISPRIRIRPSSFDELGNKPRRTRFESMVNLGVGSSNASASDLLSRDSLDGSAVRQTLIVREEGKPSTRFVSQSDLFITFRDD
jgi:hypothetical protein